MSGELAARSARFVPGRGATPTSRLAVAATLRHDTTRARSPTGSHLRTCRCLARERRTAPTKRSYRSSGGSVRGSGRWSSEWSRSATTSLLPFLRSTQRRCSARLTLGRRVRFGAARNERSVPRLALSPVDAAEALSVSRDLFDQHIRHELCVVRQGRKILISITELERWLDQNGAQTLEIDR
jgi:hypothetical protein